MISRIAKELKHHAPFTLFGALTGVVMMVIFQHIPQHIAYNTFYILHPIHVLLSALVTASIYRTYRRDGSLPALLAIGFFGSIGIATISDSLIPYFGEFMLNMPNRGCTSALSKNGGSSIRWPCWGSPSPISAPPHGSPTRDMSF
jgi:hypothetical protein